MFNWLRTKLRKWLGVDECVTQEDSKFYITQFDALVARDAALNTAIVEQGKSFEKRAQQLEMEIGNQLNPSVGSLRWCTQQDCKRDWFPDVAAKRTSDAARSP